MLIEDSFALKTSTHSLKIKTQTPKRLSINTHHHVYLAKLVRKENYGKWH
jgi:hypothetical protein